MPRTESHSASVAKLLVEGEPLGRVFWPRAGQTELQVDLTGNQRAEAVLRYRVDPESVRVPRSVARELEGCRVTFQPPERPWRAASIRDRTPRYAGALACSAACASAATVATDTPWAHRDRDRQQHDHEQRGVLRRLIEDVPDHETEHAKGAER